MITGTTDAQRSLAGRIAVPGRVRTNLIVVTLPGRAPVGRASVVIARRRPVRR